MQHDAPLRKQLSKLLTNFADAHVHRIPRTLDLIFFGCASFATIFALFEFFAAGLRPLYLLFVVLTVFILLLSRRHLWIGALSSMAILLLASWAGVEPVLFWTITVFMVSSATLRGANVFGLSALAAVSSFASCLLANDFDQGIRESQILVSVILAMAGMSSAVHSYFRYLYEQGQRIRDAGSKRIAEINQRVADERLQIARDLHDLVGHEIAMLGIHLGVAEVHTPPEAKQVHESLTAARANVQSVLAETQQILHVLRSSDNPAEAEGLPAPSAQGLEHLIASVRATGLKVNAQLDQLPPKLNPEVSTAAYRVVQEALTNAQRHGVGPVEVRTLVENQWLSISIENAKKSSRSNEDGSGLGLVGMRERTESAGGNLLIENLARSFKITATLPLAGGTH